MFNSRVGGRLKEDVDGKHRARENPLPREMTEKCIDSFISVFGAVLSTV
jgi:hypothetical protein